MRFKNYSMIKSLFFNKKIIINKRSSFKVFKKIIINKRSSFKVLRIKIFVLSYV